MRSLAAVLLLGSCATLAPSPVELEKSPAERSSRATRPGSGPKPAAGRPTLPDPPRTKPSSKVSACADLTAGDMKEAINAKLDCLGKHAK
jgi:hypothetical protein